MVVIEQQRPGVELEGSTSDGLAPVVIAAHELTVKYGSMTALNNFEFVARAGEVTAVIGPNGSGKTTFLNALTGLVAYSGTVSVAGEDATGSTPRQMFKRGVSRTFQNLDLIDDM